MPRTAEGDVHPAAWLFRAARQARSFATLRMTRPLLSNAKNLLSETSAQRGIGTAGHPHSEASDAGGVIGTALGSARPR